MHDAAAGVFTFIIMGLVGVVPLAIIALVVVWAVRSHNKRLALWTQLAGRFGLQHDNERMWGLIDACPVQVTRELRGGKNKTPWIVVSSVLSPPLDLGLAVSPQGALSSLWDAVAGNTDLPVGDPVFDDAFLVRGDEAGRVQALLTPAVRNLLLAATQYGSSMSLGDAGLSIEHRGDLDGHSWIEWALATTTQTAAATAQARWNVPAASPLMPHRSGWDDFARARGLQGMSTPLCIWGTLNERQVSVYAVRVGPMQYQFEILVRYPERLGLELLARPMATFDGLSVFFGGQDIRVGDPLFDQTFRVQGTNPPRVSALLDEPVREQMLRLRGMCSLLQVRDDGVSLRTAQIPARPEDTLALLGDASALVDLIWNNARRTNLPAAGPYR